MMKTTILYWDRREGKTTELIDKIHDHKKKHIDKLFLTHNRPEIKRLKQTYRFPMNTTVMSFNDLENGMAKELTPELIVIDNAEFLNVDVFKIVVLSLCSKTKELIITGSDRKMFDLVN